MKALRFSIIIPTHNRPDLLAEAVRSVLSQTIDDFEVVVVDDASDPPAVDGSGDPRVRVVRLDEAVGPAGARNVGLDQSVGEIVCFLDDDDLYTPDRLQIAERGLARAPVAICFARFLGSRSGANRRLEGEVADVILDGSTPGVGRTAIRREVVPRFDERWTGVEDTEWWLRIAHTAPVTTVPEVGYVVRLHDGPRGLNGADHRIERNVSFLAEHGDYFGAHPKARAFRWKRVGLLAERNGDLALARHAYRRSFASAGRVATMWHLTRSNLPGPVRRWAIGVADRVVKR